MRTRAPRLLLASLGLAACARPVPPCGEGQRIEELARAPVRPLPIAAPIAAPVRVRPPDDVATLRPDGRALAAWSYGENNAVQIWDLEQGRAGEVVPASPDLGALRAVAWSPDGRSLGRFTSWAGGAVWDLDRHTEWRTPAGAVEHVAWSPDGSRVLVGADYGNVSLLDPRAKRVVRAAQLHDPNAGAAMGFSWSPDGATVAIVQVSGSINLWDAKTGATRKTFHTSPPGLEAAVRWSPDGTLLAMPNAAGVELFDGRTGASKQVLSAAPGVKPAPVEQGPDLVLAWSPDGASLAGTRGKMIEVWDVKGATLRASLDVGDPPPHDLTWSPDGARLAYWTIGAVARLWDARRGSAPLTLRACVDVVWSRDGAWVQCSVEGDKPLELYDARTGERLPPRAASGRPPAMGVTLVQDPTGFPRLVRASDRQAIGFHRVEVRGRKVPVAVTDDGLYLGEREAAAQLLSRLRPDGKAEHLPDAELAGRERSTLLADFLGERPLPPP